MKNEILTIILITLPLFIIAQGETNSAHEGNGNAITIEETGKVGINKDVPKFQLDVGGDINTSGKIMQEGGELLPKGTIVMFHGKTIPKGWALCDGRDETPDLRDRFILGAGGRYSVNETGGSETITLEEKHLPKHNHKLSGKIITNFERSEKVGNSILNSQWFVKKPGWDNNKSTEFSGGNMPYKHLPQFWALYYIMKL